MKYSPLFVFDTLQQAAMQTCSLLATEAKALYALKGSGAFIPCNVFKISVFHVTRVKAIWNIIYLKQIFFLIFNPFFLPKQKNALLLVCHQMKLRISNEYMFNLNLCWNH